MPPESKKFLWDMRHAARNISDFVRRRAEHAYDTDLMLRSAVERQFGIPGEAPSQRRDSDEATAARITDSARITGFRDQLTQGYRMIDTANALPIIDELLPSLAHDLDVLLAEPETAH